MNLLIKITNQPGDQFPHRVVGGVSGKEYMFLFDQQLGAYVYAPKDEFEVNDIFDLVAIPFHPFRYAPVVTPEAPKLRERAWTPPPIITPDKYAEHSLDELLALCADIGLVPKRAEDAEAVRMQLHAYFLGRAARAEAERGSAVAVVTPEESSAPAPIQSEQVEV